jgi:hypothetical protein
MRRASGIRTRQPGPSTPCARSRPGGKRCPRAHARCGKGRSRDGGEHHAVHPRIQILHPEPGVQEKVAFDHHPETHPHDGHREPHEGGADQPIGQVDQTHHIGECKHEVPLPLRTQFARWPRRASGAIAFHPQAYARRKPDISPDQRCRNTSRGRARTSGRCSGCGCAKG